MGLSRDLVLEGHRHHSGTFEGVSARDQGPLRASPLNTFSPSCCPQPAVSTSSGRFQVLLVFFETWQKSVQTSFPLLYLKTG